DIAAASSSVHIDQFGFRPGTIGEQFATVLLAKRAEGIPVRLVVDSQGSDPDGSSREFYERLHAARVEIRVVRATRPITTAIAELLDRAGTTLDVVNPYVTDRGMIRRIERAARRGARVRLFVPANANNWACAGAQRFHHRALLYAGVAILEYPAMLHAKAFSRDGEELLVGTCNLEAWSLKRFFEIDVLVRSRALATQFEERFSAPAVAVSSPGRPLVGARERLRAGALAAVSPLL